MTNMIADYFKEMQQYDLLEITDKGFIMYHKWDIPQTDGSIKSELHLAHMYVKPEYRRTGLAQEMAASACTLGKEMGCSFASCIVTLPDKTKEQASRLVRIYMEFGFSISQVINNNQIVLTKDLQ